MKHTFEVIRKEDNPRAFKLGVTALQKKLDLVSWDHEGIHQYAEDIEGGTEYITVEMSEDVITFDIMTKYDDVKPVIVGKIDLTKHCDSEFNWDDLSPEEQSSLEATEVEKAEASDIV